MNDNVPVEVLQKAFEDSGLSLRELAYRMGWSDYPNRGGYATQRVQRILGMKSWYKNGKIFLQKTVTPRLAKKLAEAMGFDPVELNF